MYPPPQSSPGIPGEEVIASPQLKPLGENRAKLAFVDALRGLAIFGVMLVHCTTTSNPIGSPTHDRGYMPVWLAQQGRAGARGVQLFYLVSAFTLFLSMSRRKRKEIRPFLNFFIRRFARIAPMFYVSVALSLAIWGFGYQPWRSAPNVTPGALVSTLLFCNQLHPYWITSIVPGGWSVAVEMLFYLTVPGLFLLIRNIWWALGLTLAAVILSVVLNHQLIKPEHTPAPFRINAPDAWSEKTGLPMQVSVTPVHPARVHHDRGVEPPSPAQAAPRGRSGRQATLTQPTAAALAGIAGLHHVFDPSALPQSTPTGRPERQGQFDSWKTFLLFWLPTQLPVFCLGFVFFFIYPKLHELSHKPNITALAWLMLGVVVLILWWLPKIDLDLIPPLFQYGLVYLLLAASLALYANPAMVNPFWTYLGKVSYSAYLLHFIILEKVSLPALAWVQTNLHFHLPPVGFLFSLLGLTLGLTLIVSTLSFWWIEQPGQALGKKWIDKLEGRPTRQSNLPEPAPAVPVAETP